MLVSAKSTLHLLHALTPAHIVWVFFFSFALLLVSSTFFFFFFSSARFCLFIQFRHKLHFVYTHAFRLGTATQHLFMNEFVERATKMRTNKEKKKERTKKKEHTTKRWQDNNNWDACLSIIHVIMLILLYSCHGLVHKFYLVTVAVVIVIVLLLTSFFFSSHTHTVRVYFQCMHYIPMFRDGMVVAAHRTRSTYDYVFICLFQYSFCIECAKIWIWINWKKKKSGDPSAIWFLAVSGDRDTRFETIHLWNHTMGSIFTQIYIKVHKFQFYLQ